jgi:5-methylcytosine-specific restriction protein A
MADPAHKFYTQAPWRKARAEYLEAHPICEELGCIAPATRVDHQTPIREGGALFDWRNLRAYCQQHDSAKSSRRGERWGR